MFVWFDKTHKQNWPNEGLRLNNAKIGLIFALPPRIVCMIPIGIPCLFMVLELEWRKIALALSLQQVPMIF